MYVEAGKYLARVRLDGVDISSDCYAADDQRGLTWCYQRDRDGRRRVVRDRFTGTHIATEVRSGDVEISDVVRKPVA